MKILIITKNWLGDLLFQLPAIEAIRSAYPGAEIVCMAPARCHEMLEAYPAVDRVLTFDEKKEHRNWLKRFQFMFQLRKEKWDQVFLFHRSRTRAFLVFLAGAKERYGYGNNRGWFLTKAVQEPKEPVHQVDYFFHLLKEVGIAYTDAPTYRFCYSQKSLEAIEDLLKQHHLQRQSFVCFHLGANWEPKRWPPAHFSKLADLIHQTWNLPVVVTGAAQDLPLAHKMIYATKHARVISLVAQTNLEELGALYAQAAFVVSGDSGPMHIASGVGTPVVALFGPTDPKLTGPRGVSDTLVLHHVPTGYHVPWYREDMPKEGWLSQIRPHDVVRNIAKKGWMEKQTKSYPAVSKSPLQKIFNSRSNGQVQSILFVTLSNIGDVILTTPAIMALTAKFPQARMTVVAGPRAKGILEASRWIDRLIIYDKRTSLGKRWQFLKELRKESYDWVVDLRNTAIPYLVSAKKRSPIFRSFQKINMRERHLEVLEKMGFQTSEDIPPFDFFNTHEEMGALEKIKAKGIQEKEGWILMAPAAASELKTWPLNGFREVVEKILSERKENILLLGDQRERDLAQPLAEINRDRIFNLAGETSLRELSAIVSRGALLISNDSAIMHLGFEMNRPVVAIFGPTNHEKYGHIGSSFRVVREPMFCSPCEKPTCRFERQACFEDLKAEKVWQACRDLLDHPSDILTAPLGYQT